MGNSFVENAERIGQSTASMIVPDSLPLNPEEVLNLVERHQVKVEIIPIGDLRSNPKVRALYHRNMKLITIEEASLEGLKRACERLGLGPVSRVDMLAMHIAHEFFHHLEETGKVPFSLYYNFEKQNSNGKYANLLGFKSIISMLYIGPPLVLLREAAAHSFVKALLGLSVSPECIEKNI